MAASARGGHKTSRGAELGCKGGRRARVNIWWVVWAVIWDSSGLELANKKSFVRYIGFLVRLKAIFD
jgi:hypothetical protein